MQNVIRTKYESFTVKILYNVKNEEVKQDNNEELNYEVLIR